MDNFVVRVALFRRQLMAGNNSRTLTTEQGLAGMARVNMLRCRSGRGDVLLGEAFDSSRVTRLWADFPELMKVLAAPNCNSPTFHALTRTSWLKKLSPGLTIPRCGYTPRLFPLPSAEGLSSKYSDYENVFLRRWFEWASEVITHGHLIATHDTEYVLHLLKALQLAKTDAELRKLTGGGSFSCLTSSTA